MECNTEKKILMKNLLNLPEEIILPKLHKKVILDVYETADFEEVYKIIKEAIAEGVYYPTATIDREKSLNYIPDESFLIRDYHLNEILGFFFIKPNFPGRSSHICNAGFVVNHEFRQKGIGEILYKKYLFIAKKLGYEGSLFNSVYALNTGAVKICRKLGFTEIGRIPKAGKLKGLGYVDALEFYYDLTTLDENSFQNI